MPFITINSLGPFKKVRFLGHESAEAYDKQAGVVGECVETADTSDWYRSLSNVAASKIMVLLLATGITRKVNAEATAKAKEKKADASDVLESFVPYANRVKLTLDATEEGKAQWAEIDKKVHEITEALEADSSSSAREKGPDKGALAKADDILSRDDAGVEAAVTKLLNVVEGYELERDEAGKPDRLSLARLVMEFLKQSL